MQIAPNLRRCARLALLFLAAPYSFAIAEVDYSIIASEVMHTEVERRTVELSMRCSCVSVPSGFGSTFETRVKCPEPSRSAIHDALKLDDNSFILSLHGVGFVADQIMGGGFILSSIFESLLNEKVEPGQRYSIKIKAYAFVMKAR